jgi:hypothetical protein
MLDYTFTIDALVSVESTSIIHITVIKILRGMDLYEILDEFNDQLIAALEDQDTTIIKVALQESPNGIKP